MAELHVIFGAGPLGRWTAHELLSMGKSVRIVNHSGKMIDPPAGVELVASDATDTEKNIQITRDAAVIYQCAMPPYYDLLDKFPPLQKAILNAAIANHAILVIPENLYLYGKFTGTLTEDSPVAPVSKKGRLRAAMAAEIQEAQAAGKVRSAIGRASDFFGPYDKGLTNYAFMPPVWNKPAGLIGRPDQPHSFTYIKDFSHLLVTLGTRPEALGQVWFAPTNPPITQAELMKLIETELGKPSKALYGNAFLMSILGLFDKTTAASVEMIYQWTAPFVIDSSKAEKAFSLKPTPMNTMVHETIEWCRQQTKP